MAYSKVVKWFNRLSDDDLVFFTKNMLFKLHRYINEPFHGLDKCWVCGQYQLYFFEGEENDGGICRTGICDRTICRMCMEKDDDVWTYCPTHHPTSATLFDMISFDIAINERYASQITQFKKS